MQTTGWLFDLYPWRNRLVLWFITGTGERLRLEDDFPYRLYLGGPDHKLRRLAQTLGRRSWVRRTFFTHGMELLSGREIPVLAVEIRDYGLLPRLRAWLGTLEEDLAAYNCDLDPGTYYLYSRRAHPCAWYGLEAEAGRLLALTPREDPFALEFAPPPLATMTLGLTQDPLIPLGAGNGLALGWEGRTLELEAPDAPGLVAETAHWLQRLDPDLVLSDWGDEKIIPLLWHWSRQYRRALPLDREAEPAPRQFKQGRSYFSYGQIIYQGASVPFFGRWHLDRRNSFFFREAGLMGLMQIARIGQMPLQQAARTSPGTLITSMQLARAVADGILIPWRKGDPERFKTAGELLTIDKGGLTFMPPVGLHFRVAELDFASMYPTIMAIHNLSPETVNCVCCREGEKVKRLKGEEVLVASGQWPVASNQNGGIQATGNWQLAINRQNRAITPLSSSQFPVNPVAAVQRPAAGNQNDALLAPDHWPLTPALPAPAPWPLVPETNYRVCRRREGLVPRTLRPILLLRERLKARAKELPPEDAVQYKSRQNALKWMLVTCFGYLGYKNARFGRIEAHEAVTAYGRDKLLTAKEVCENRGYAVLHGLTDCLWIQKEGVHAAGLEELCAEITGVTGVRLAIEGVYRWIAFLGSRQNPERPVATRYFGVFADGSLKVRGLICRRRDTPPFVRQAQEALLQRLTTAATAGDLAALLPALEEMSAGFRGRVREGGIAPRDLVITRVLSQPVEEYRVDTATALAARQLQGAGIQIVPGEKVRYVQLARTGPKETRVRAAPFLDALDGYDAGLYLELLDRAIDEVLLPFREMR